MPNQAMTRPAAGPMSRTEVEQRQPLRATALARSVSTISDTQAAAGVVHGAAELRLSVDVPEPDDACRGQGTARSSAVASRAVCVRGRGCVAWGKGRASPRTARGWATRTVCHAERGRRVVGEDARPSQSGDVAHPCADVGERSRPRCRCGSWGSRASGRWAHSLATLAGRRRRQQVPLVVGQLEAREHPLVAGLRMRDRSSAVSDRSSCR